MVLASGFLGKQSLRAKPAVAIQSLVVIQEALAQAVDSRVVLQRSN
jgi:hypothetical protein